MVANAKPISHIELKTSDYELIGKSLAYFVDVEQDWTFQRLVANLEQPVWQHSLAESPNLGLLKTPVWFALRMSSTKSISRLLEISYPSLKHIDIYLLENGKPTLVVHTGNSKPFSERLVEHRNFLVPIEIKADKEYLLLMRVQTGGALQLPVTLWEPHTFYETDQRVFGTIMLFTGIMLAMAIYNLMLYFGIREPSYLLYVLCVVSIAWTQLGLRGIVFQYVWPSHPEYNEIGLSASIALNVIFVGFFSDSFLKMREMSVNTSRIVRGFAWLGVLLLIFAFFVEYSTSIRPLIALSFVASFVNILAGLYLWFKGQELAKYYVIAWGLFLLGTITYTLNKFGVLPYTPLSEHAMIIGASFQVLFLSFALAYRINLEKRQRLFAQNKALVVQNELLDAQKAANEELELRVSERTQELEEAYRELKRLSQIDGLTKIQNRQSFDKALKTEWNRNCRDVKHISLLMVDADFFKNINDTWGHLCGDACLQHIAKICEESSKRAADTVARYGGEEFVLLLPATDLNGAARVAERIRETIEETPFEWNGHNIKLTVSIGVASSLPNQQGNYEELIQFSDQALYAAKDQGRNVVMVYHPYSSDEQHIYPFKT